MGRSTTLTAPPRCVVFDLDGTLADTADDVAALISGLLVQAGGRAITRAEAIACFGRGADQFVASAVALQSMPLDQSGLAAAFKARYATAPTVFSRLYPHALDTLTTLRDAGHPLGLCTNKPHDAAQTLLAALDIAAFFPAISAGDTTRLRKPDAGHLLDAIARVGGAPGRAVMIGDSETDCACARAAGIPCILIAGGYAHAPLATLGAAKILASLVALPAAIAALDRPTRQSREAAALRQNLQRRKQQARTRTGPGDP